MTGAAFYDGITSRRQTVEVSLHPDGLAIFGSDGHRLALWPYPAIRRIDGFARAGLAVTRLPEPGSSAEPRLEITDAAFAAELAARAPLTLTAGATGRRERRKVVFWALGAIASLLLLAFYGLPAIAGRLAPLVPASAEIRLGEAMDPQVRGIVSDAPLKTCTAPDGLAALNDLVARYERQADLHLPLRVVVLDHGLVNAFALPGGYIYLFNGLIQRARSPDELAGVLAHEIGHVKLRHSLRSAIQAGGLGFLLGTVFGDFAGGTAVIIASRTLMSRAFSRDAEREADRFGVELMLRAGGDPVALARFFESVSSGGGRAFAWIATHPTGVERERAIRQSAENRPRVGPALTPEQWTALRAICQKTD
ncbi:M48 family metallopeptidase [Phreatobacter sp.]|uniref:M48 family metallopeptidase n=1 Tax=Phreatobacter sp. TaxID=1966341 RepID=UPI003F6EC3CB